MDALCPGGLNGCPDRPDYLGVHVYDDNIQDFIAQVERYHNEFGLDIVLSEVACFVSSFGISFRLEVLLHGGPACMVSDSADIAELGQEGCTYPAASPRLHGYVLALPLD
jgi:hypothetical protein